MAVMKQYFVRCDLCYRDCDRGVIAEGGKSGGASSESRKRARAVGWTRKRLGQGMADLCHECREREKARA